MCSFSGLFHASSLLEKLDCLFCPRLGYSGHFQKLSRFDVASLYNDYVMIGYELNRLLSHIIVHHSLEGNAWRRVPLCIIFIYQHRCLSGKASVTIPSCTNLTSCLPSGEPSISWVAAMERSKVIHQIQVC